YFFANNEMSYALAASKWDRNLGVEGLAEVALCMPFLLAALYFVVWRSAKHADRDLGEFLAKNFQYLRNLNFLSDLFVKFVVLSLAVLSLHG
ncbi:hypothetical protein, partial [Klebsiella pneumoniae]|uniref:hypothetical protein n=1 Tax=Klebsiella pneumoniae TaxID=573 RepID=UPI003BD6BEE2